MTRVSVSDVCELCEELGVIGELQEDQHPDEVIEVMVNDDAMDFLCRYTGALLDAIMHGASNLTGTEEYYKGFGKRISPSHVQMILKKKCDAIML